MSSLLFLRDDRVLPFIPVAQVALTAIAEVVPSRRLSYARSLYLALLEICNATDEGRSTKRVAVTRAQLVERAGISRRLVSELWPELQTAGVIEVSEQKVDGMRMEHEWVIVDPTAKGTERASGRHGACLGGGTERACPHARAASQPSAAQLETKEQQKKEKKYVESDQSTKIAKTSNDNALVRDVFRYWQQTCGHPNAKLTQDRRSRVAARLREGFTAEQIRMGIDGAARAAWVNDEGRRFDDLELICRSGSKLEGFIERASPPVVNGDGHRNGRNGNGYGRPPANEDLFQGLKAKVQANGNGKGPYVDADARDIEVLGLLNGGPA